MTLPDNEKCWCGQPIFVTHIYGEDEVGLCEEHGLSHPKSGKCFRQGADGVWECTGNHEALWEEK